MIPLWLWIRVEEQGKRRLALPIPLSRSGCCWPPCCSCCCRWCSLAALLSWPWGWGFALLKIYFHIFVMIGSMSGLKLDISSREHDKITRIIMQ